MNFMFYELTTASGGWFQCVFPETPEGQKLFAEWLALIIAAHPMSPVANSTITLRRIR